MQYLKKALGYFGDNLWLLPAIVGLLLVFIVPPYQSPDEQTHLYRAYQLSEGKVFGKKLSYGSGDLLPNSLPSSFERYRYIIFNKDAKTNPQQLAENFRIPLQSSNKIETRFENTVIYPPFSYVPQVAGIAVGRVFSLGPIWLLFIARVSVLATWIVSLRFMMKRHKQLLLPLFAFSMLPIVLFQSASASADMVTVTITTLAITEIIRGFSRRITSSNVIFLGVLGGILALSKFPYSIVLLPALWLPKSNFAIKRQSFFLKLAITGSVLLSLIWVIIANHSFINLRAFVDTPEQLSFMLYHPISYGLIVFRTLFSTYGDTLLLQLSGILGWLDTKLPLWVTFTSLFSVLLTIITAKLSPSKTIRWIFWSTIACTILAIISLLYLTWCAPKAALVDGLQGRYFIPLIGLLIGAIGGSLPVSTRTYTRVRYWVICVGLITGLMTILTLVSRYY